MGPIEISSMEKPGEPIIGAIKRTADKGSDVCGSEEAVPG
jgi:hypothetical protein